MPFSPFTAKTAVDLFRELKSSEQGLTSIEAEKRLKQYGPNELTAQQAHWWQVWARQFRSSFVYLLGVAGLISVALGDRLEAGLILFFILINSSLGFYQEFRSEQSLKLLKKFVKTMVRVRRNGQTLMVESATLVPGDMVLIEAGDVVPADLRLIEAHDLEMDESALSGESVPVKKLTDALPKPAAEIYRAFNVGFSGTTVESGKGLGMVIGTGVQTEFGNIGRLTTEISRPSGFEKSLQEFSRFILRLVIITIGVIFIANILVKGHRAHVAELFVFSLALVVSVVPEALPLITSISLSRGALRLAKSKVVVKRLSAIEDLGSLEILCTDKTGTITENALIVAEIESSDPKNCLLYAAAASHVHEEQHTTVNSFDTAIFKKLTVEEKRLLAGFKRQDEIPFDPVRRRNSVWIKHRGKNELIVRGAPETIFSCCTLVGAKERKSLLAWMKREGAQGRRVIAVATKELPAHTTEYHAKDEKDLKILGLISFLDPIKATAKHAIQQAEALGVRIKILTGDSADVATAVGRQIALIDEKEEAMIGEEWDALSTEEREHAADTRSVFARVSPEQKYQIIQALQKKFEVGYMGDGVNDAPALKIANVGLAVQSAAGIAREAADIVLLQKSLDVVVNGIKQGRQIFANIVKYIRIALASNFGNFYSIGLASLLIPFLPMLPIQILLENLLSDLPLIAISTDNVDLQELRRPKNYQIRNILLFSTILGALATLFDFIFFGLFYHMGARVLQTHWFLLSIITELVFIFSIRTRLPFWKSRSPSLILTAMIFAVLAISIVLPFTAFGQTAFHFVRPSSGHLMTVLGLSVCYLIANEVVKNMYYRMVKSPLMQVKPA